MAALRPAPDSTPRVAVAARNISWQATVLIVAVMACLTYAGTSILRPEPARYRYEKLTRRTSGGAVEFLYRIDQQTGKPEFVVGAGAPLQSFKPESK